MEREDELTLLRRTNAALEQRLQRMRDGDAGALLPAARIRELERRCKEAEERTQRERAGAHERAARDEERIRCVTAPYARALTTENLRRASRCRHDVIHARSPMNAVVA